MIGLVLYTRYNINLITLVVFITSDRPSIPTTVHDLDLSGQIYIYP